MEETCGRVGYSTVKINLPVLTADQRNDYQTFEVEWRKLDTSIWQETTASTTASSVNLPGELSDGSYEVGVRATGTGGQSLFTTLLRFPLSCVGKVCKNSKVFPFLISFQDALYVNCNKQCLANFHVLPIVHKTKKNESRWC